MFRQKDSSVKLYEILLLEYEKLGILDEQISKIKKESDAEFVGLDWNDFSVNDWIQVQRLKKIRRHLPKTQQTDNENTNKKSVISPSALCFSGGGIRSATFCLGVLQGLAKYGLLDKFDYLSTVSGGGYIGSWLSAWIDRAGSVEKVQASLSRDEMNPYLFELKDFNINYSDADALEKIKLLKKLLRANRGIFTKEITANLDKINLPKGSDIEKIIAKNHEIKRFLKEFCKILNQILLNKKIVEENQQFCLTLEKSSLERIKETRLKFEEIFEDFLAKPYLFKQEDLSSNFSNDAILAAFNKTFKEPEDEIFYKDLLNLLTLKKDFEQKAFQEFFLENLNEKILSFAGNIERIKKRRRIFKNLEGIFKKYDESDFLQNKETANIKVEPEEITHLRTYSNYMSPKLGLFSTDTFSLIGLYLRNLFLNWLVFVPIIAAVLLIPKIFLWILDRKSIFLDLEKLFPGRILEFLGTNASKIRELFFQITPYSLNYTYLLIAATIVGIFSIIFINIFRPSLSEETLIKQNYEIDETIGITKTFENKVRSMCFYPLVLTSIILAIYWNWKGIDSERIVEFSYYFILFGIVLFIVSFIIARSIFYGWNIFRFKVKKDSTAKIYAYSDYKNAFKELIISLVCGATGGLILYFVTERFANLPGVLSDYKNPVYLTIAPPVFLFVFLICATLFVGIASKITDDMDREWMTRFGAMILKFLVGWIVIFGTVLLGEEILKILSDWMNIPALLASIGGISGLITLGLGFSSASTEEKDDSKGGFKSLILSVAPQIAAPVFIIFLVGLIAYLTGLLMNYLNILNPWIWFFLFAGFGGLLGFWININKFSLHAMYRERLIRAYLGASRIRERFKTANSFTGLDVLDNVEMKYLVQKPYHVVNMTLNLVKAQDLRFQNRKAESFTASGLFCGSSNMGNGTGHFRSSETYGRNEQNRRSITLGTAAAISGAAASPNMGYYTVSSAVSFLMTLFNIRLGWWLGNPGKMGQETYKKASPRWSPKLFFDEALGNTTNIYPYIYVSDGGHFENLGIYEMVLRRCKFILAIDSGADAKFTFSDLGNAVHKIRVDMGIPIVFEQTPIKSRYCTIAKIKYSESDGAENSDDGILIYIKPTLDGTEPIDIQQYQTINKDFPHETTADQMYSETQFESYRSLGFHIIDTICRAESNLKCEDFNKFRQLAETYVSKFEEKSESKKESDIKANVHPRK